MLGGAAE
ncbi:hypothetical protein ACMD2_18069 [Ananas comosus]|nr:hypothetical protein ACMD2_18069 [Ananas comosus]